MIEDQSSASRFLIVGQGLAGTAVAWSLWRRKVPFLIVDPQEAMTSSKLAAGLITPITGIRVNKSWRLEELYTFAEAYYRDLEVVLGEKFFTPCSVVRCIKSDLEMNRWKKRWSESDCRAWVKRPELQEHDYPSWLQTPMGGFEQNGAAWLDTQVYLRASREFFESLGSYEIGEVKEEELEVKATDVTWAGRHFSHVILARGWKQKESRFFPWLDFNSARGVIASVELEGVKADDVEAQVIHHHTWIQTRPDRAWRCGSTYEFDFARPLEESLEEIREKLHKTLKVNFRLFDAAAAIRPIVHRRSLVVGRHPAYARIGVVNGLGSKGTLRAPYFGNQLCESFLEGREIEKEIDVP